MRSQLADAALELLECLVLAHPGVITDRDTSPADVLENICANMREPLRDHLYNVLRGGPRGANARGIAGLKISMNEVFCVVEGAGPFPMDMLRYDGCFPTEEADAYALALESVDVTGPRRVMLSQWSATHPSEAWTEDRWASFGWRVIFRGGNRVEAAVAKMTAP